MKTILAILTVLFVCAALLFWSARTQPTDIDIVLLDDVTDTLELKPEISTIESFFRLDEDKWKGIRFQYIHLTDLQLNAAQKLELKSESWVWGNELERLKTVKKFKINLQGLGSTILARPTGKSQSSLYTPLARELKVLSESTAKRKTLIAYSDLMENTETVSFYDTATFSLLERDPVSIQKLLEKQVQLENLGGITVYLVYQPTTPLQDNRFSETASFYRNWLESKGATVFIQARLDLTP
jgi:hypothetical protein